MFSISTLHKLISEFSEKEYISNKLHIHINEVIEDTKTLSDMVYNLVLDKIEDEEFNSEFYKKLESSDNKINETIKTINNLLSPRA